MSDDRRCVDFIVAVGIDGVAIEVTCDPGELNNAFNSTPDRPSYFTPVFFERAVLQRYLSRPDLYVIGEAGMSCSGNWNIRLDASRADYVVAMLGDLGKCLPYEQQLHWRSHNVHPDGGFSKEFIDRNFHNRPSEWTQPDHAFVDRLSGFKMAWKEEFGWSLFRDLAVGDQYLLDSLHVPLQGTQGEFDGQVLALAKILCDSINSERLLAPIGDTEENRVLKPIQRLEAWLRLKGVGGFESQTAVLRDIQSLRSAGSAHGKGSEYERTLRRLGLAGMDLSEAFSRLLVRAHELLDYLGETLLKGSTGRGAD